MQHLCAFHTCSVACMTVHVRALMGFSPCAALHSDSPAWQFYHALSAWYPWLHHAWHYAIKLVAAGILFS